MRRHGYLRQARYRPTGVDGRVATVAGTVHRAGHVLAVSRSVHGVASLQAALAAAAGVVLVPAEGPPLVVLRLGDFLRHWQARHPTHQGGRHPVTAGL